MGSSESKQQQLDPWTVLLNRFQPTGVPVTDKARAKQVNETITGWDARFWPFSARSQLHDLVRQLDPGNWEYTHAQAYSIHLHSSAQSVPNAIQLRQKEERLWQETIRLGYPDHNHIAHQCWAAAVAAQGPHRKADEEAILNRIKSLGQTSEKEREEAAAAAQSGDWAKATRCYREASRKSNDPEDRYKLAWCLVNWKTLASPEALQACQEAFEGRKIIPAENINQENKDANSQYEWLQQTIAAGPHFQAAVRYRESGQLNHAIGAASRAFDYWQGFQVRDLFVDLLTKAESWRKAERLMREGHSIAAASHEHEMQLAAMYARRGRYYDAISLLEQRSRRKGLSPQETAQCLQDLRMYRAEQAEAQTAVKTALRDPRTNVFKLLQLANFFYFERDYSASVDVLRCAIKVGSVDASTYGSLGDTFWAMKQKETAIDHYHQALSLDKTHDQALIWRTRTGTFPEVANDWADAIKWDPCAQYFALIGMRFSTSNPYYPAWIAEEALETAIQLEPGHRDAKEWEAHLARVQRLVEKVKQEQAMRAAGNDPEKDKIMAGLYYSNRAYGVVGSTNQYTLDYAPGGRLNTS